MFAIKIIIDNMISKRSHAIKHLSVFLSIHFSFFKGSGYFAVDGNLPLESILP